MRVFQFEIYKLKIFQFLIFKYFHIYIMSYIIADIFAQFSAPWGEWSNWSACPDVNVQCGAIRYKQRNCSTGNDDFGKPYCGSLTDATLEEQCPKSDCGKVKNQNFQESFFCV